MDDLIASLESLQKTLCDNDIHDSGKVVHAINTLDKIIQRAESVRRQLTKAGTL